jgi:hypothetical protein
MANTKQFAEIRGGQTTTNNAIARATRAEQIINDPIFAEAMEMARNEIVRRLEEVDQDTKLGMRLVDMLQAQKRFQRMFERTMMTGQIAESYLEKKSLFNREGV